MTDGIRVHLLRFLVPLFALGCECEHKPPPKEIKLEEVAKVWRALREEVPRMHGVDLVVEVQLPERALLSSRLNQPATVRLDSLAALAHYIDQEAEGGSARWTRAMVAFKRGEQQSLAEIDALNELVTRTDKVLSDRGIDVVLSNYRVAPYDPDE